MFSEQLAEIDRVGMSWDIWRMAESATVTRAVETKLHHLADNVRKDLRIVMRNLTEMRRLTGVTEVVNLGKFLAEVGAEELSVLSVDARVREACERGNVVGVKLIEAEGGSISAQEAAERLGISKQAVLTRYKKGMLVGWKKEKQAVVRFPVWQFKGGRVMEGFEVVLAQLNLDPSMDDRGRLLFFLSESRFLTGKTPLQCLRQGELQKVILAVQGYANNLSP